MICSWSYVYILLKYLRISKQLISPTPSEWTQRTNLSFSSKVIKKSRKRWTFMSRAIANMQKRVKVDSYLKKHIWDAHLYFLLRKRREQRKWSKECESTFYSSPRFIALMKWNERPCIVVLYNNQVRIQPIKSTTYFCFKFRPEN